MGSTRYASRALTHPLTHDYRTGSGIIKGRDMTTEKIVRHYRTGQPWRVCFRDGAVERLEPCDQSPNDGLILAPALFDIQVNGFAGVDFNAWTLQAEDLLQATRALAQYGVTRFLPTVVTGPPDRMRMILQVILEATRRYPEVG